MLQKWLPSVQPNGIQLNIQLKINTLLYADDQLIISDNENLQRS